MQILFSSVTLPRWWIQLYISRENIKPIFIQCKKWRTTLQSWFQIDSILYLHIIQSYLQYKASLYKMTHLKNRNISSFWTKFGRRIFGHIHCSLNFTFFLTIRLYIWLLIKLRNLQHYIGQNTCHWRKVISGWIPFKNKDISNIDQSNFSCSVGLKTNLISITTIFINLR